MLEADVEGYFRGRVKANGGRSYKLKFLGIVGAPDLLVILGGLHLVETKRPKHGRLSPTQQMRHDEIRMSGGKVDVIWSYKDANDWFTAQSGRLTIL